MRSKVHHLYLKACRSTTWCALACCAPLTSQAAVYADEYELHAAFIYNFTLYTNWPEPKKFINICAFGNAQQMRALRQYENTRTSQGTITVTAVDDTDSIKSCDVLYFRRTERNQYDEFRKSFSSLPIVVIGEYGLPDSDAVTILLQRDGNKLSFNINRNTVTRFGIQFSYKLLAIAKPAL